jgi:hypothetical protein
MDYLAGWARFVRELHAFPLWARRFHAQHVARLSCYAPTAVAYWQGYEDAAAATVDG